MRINTAFRNCFYYLQFMKVIFSFLFILLATIAVAQKNYLVVGTYTSGKSKGIYVYDFNKDGSAKLVDSAVTTNPSYLTVSPDQKFVYAVNETAKGKVSAYSFHKGHLNFINQVSSEGDDPCYITETKNSKWVIVANYSSGTAAVFPVEKNGSLGNAADIIAHKGHGPNTSRQQSAHIHSTVLSPDNKYVFIADLGIDKEKIYALNNDNGMLTAYDSVHLNGGAGPRHFEFHPSGKWAYLMQELSGAVTVLDYKDGKLKPIQTISALTKGFHQFFTGADVHVSKDGKFLYASVRDSANLISIFKIDSQNGMLSLAGTQSVLGRTPRNFNFDPSGDFLLAANQNSNDIVVFKVNHTTGLLKDTGKRIGVGNPVCIKWIHD